MAPLRLSALVAWACAACLFAGCGSGERPPGGTREGRVDGAPALQPVSLPELAGSEPALQERLRASYASLTAVREAGDTSSARLAAAYGEVGKLLLAAELLQHAEPYLLNARALAPSELAWPYYLGHVHRLRNERERAIAYFEEARGLDGDYVPALIWLGAVHLDRGDPSAAEPLFRKAAVIEPNSAAALFGLGRAGLAAGDYAGARQHLEAALAADPGATRAHYPLAMAYRALGDAAQADAHLARWKLAFSPSESLKDGQIYPADPLMEQIGSILQTAVAYETRGVAALDAGRLTEAITQFREGLKVAPRDPALHQNLGTALYLADDEAGARAEFESAIRLAPGYARAHFSLGLLAESGAQDAQALERYATAIRHDPTLADARFRLAEGLRRAGQVEASLAHYDRIVSADPRASQARFGRAMALVRLRRYAEARAALEDAVRTHPEQPGFPHALARLLAAAPDDQVRDGRRALSIVEGLIEAHGPTLALIESLAMALAEVGRFREAAARQRDVIAAARDQGRADVAEALTSALRQYESGAPCRTPWRDDDPVHVPARASGLRF